MFKTIIIVPFFGDLPWYFDYFIKSCEFNCKIDFNIISDTNKLSNLPANVKHYYLSLDELNRLVSTRLNLESKIESGYKFCDFKPAYGYIFYDLIRGYDYWGQSDVDIILGDVFSFVENLKLWQYDYINVRHDFVTGFFSIFKNSEKMNTLFMRSKDYKIVFSESKHYCFDECNNVHEEITHGKSIFDCTTEIESFMHVLKSAEMNNELKAYFEFICIEGKSGRIKFDNGKIIYKNKFEAILYHLIAFKRTCKMYYPTKPIPSQYNISPLKIYVPKRDKTNIN